MEIQEFEKQKDKLETELKREEREQFDDASNEILMYLKSKEDDLSRSSASCKTEANVVNIWLKFLEDTWNLQTAQNDSREKQVVLEVAQRIDKESPKTRIKRKALEEEYLNLEGKFLTALSIVDAMQKQFCMQSEGIYRKETEGVRELFDALAKIKEEFESVERLTLKVETPTLRLQSRLPDKNLSPTSS
ncbi:uncharacterized protein LOC123201422 [Mangifera indica]|uniref:uncharacterized protein LOC123201422 n=1 Tax=Mangifera indica TaxID=29780 RepID=UPI001CFA234F|nr:uncharacterized protein LOC123201422 [Mangifera indica]